MSTWNSLAPELERCEAALRRGEADHALVLLANLAAQTTVLEDEATPLLDALARAALAAGSPAVALAVAAYRSDEATEQQLVDALSPRLRARTQVAWA
ncbi:MAG: hypothetical protein FJ096_19655, partial [Deltaproteobacteria bacterium]|nr:hypothetical protein [Deltaproteobacteria bacterium]